MPQLSITKQSLRVALRGLDRTDHAAEERFLDLLTDACSNTKETVPASAMTERELAQLFYSNRILVQLGISEVSYPRWKVRVTDTNTPAYRWTEDALNKVANAWSIQSSESKCRIFIEILITGCITHLHQPPTSESASSAPESLPTPFLASHTPPRLNSFGEVSLKHLVHAEHDYVLSGRADFAIGYGATEHGTSPAMDSYLTVVEVQHAGTFVAAWAQMMAYVGMVHRSRVARGKKSVTVYGICSDGIRYLFARVDNKGLLWRSSELSIVSQRPHVYSYVLHILSAAQLSTPSTSPTKAGELRETQTENFEVEVEQKYFKGDMGGAFVEVEDEDAEDFVML